MLAIKQMKVVMLLCLLTAPSAVAQPGSAGAAALTPRTSAPFDIEGYWISVVNEDWMFRMVTPPAGEYGGVPLNRAGREIADSWNPDDDAQSGDLCRAYGAPALLRIPGRIRFEWQDEDTLLLQTEAGEQTRSIEFLNAMGGAATRQGLSFARWELAGGTRGERHGNLRVETSNLLPGYLRKNGVPYSDTAQVTEFLSIYPAPNGDTWLVVTTEVEDPRYLSQSFITSTHFKKLADAEGSRYWQPLPCSVR
jgi:hypothetical protein